MECENRREEEEQAKLKVISDVHWLRVTETKIPATAVERID